MTYNMTQLQNSYTISALFNYANNSTDGVLAIGLMIGIFFILLLILKRFEFIQAIVTSSFLCFILSGILAYAGYMSIWGVLLFLIITAFSTLYMYVKKE